MAHSAGLNVPQDTALVHPINNITLIRLDKQEAGSALEVLIRHMLSRGWEINFTKFQGPITSVKVLGAQASEEWAVPTGKGRTNTASYH